VNGGSHHLQLQNELFPQQFGLLEQPAPSSLQCHSPVATWQAWVFSGYPLGGHRPAQMHEPLPQ